MARSVGVNLFDDGLWYRGTAGSGCSLGPTLTCSSGRGFAGISYDFKLIGYGVLSSHVVRVGARNLAMTLSIVDLIRSGYWRVSRWTREPTFSTRVVGMGELFPDLDFASS